MSTAVPRGATARGVESRQRQEATDGPSVRRVPRDRAGADQGAGPVQGGVADPGPPGPRDQRRRPPGHGAQLLRQQLPRPFRPPRASSAAAHRALEEWGYGLSSVRFICGTQDLHKELERRVAAFLGMEDTILYAACFDANGGVFEPLLGEDARSSPTRSTTPRSSTASACARRSATSTSTWTWPISRPSSRQAQRRRYRLIATDGVFSMDGDIAPLDEICDLADTYDALVHGRRLPLHRLHRQDRPRHARVLRRHGARRHHHHHLRQGPGRRQRGLRRRQPRRSWKSCANAAAPTSSPTPSPRSWPAPRSPASICSRETTELRDRLETNTDRFRERMTAAGFDIRPGDHPIVPIMFRLKPTTRPSPRTSPASCSTRAST